MCCIYLTNTNTHSSPLTGQTWPMKQSITCEDSRVIYSITSSHKAGKQCLRSQAQYGGKVGGTRPCQVRCRHRAAVEHHFDKGAGTYFNLPGHDLADFNFQPFEKIRSRGPFVLENRECLWVPMSLCGYHVFLQWQLDQITSYNWSKCWF